MNSTSPAHSSKDGVIAVIGASALLIGAATGSAIAMLIISLVTLVLLAVIDRQRLSSRPLVLLGAVALSALLVSAAIAIWA